MCTSVVLTGYNGRARAPLSLMETVKGNKNSNQHFNLPTILANFKGYQISKLLYDFYYSLKSFQLMISKRFPYHQYY